MYPLLIYEVLLYLLTYKDLSIEKEKPYRKRDLLLAGPQGFKPRTNGL